MSEYQYYEFQAIDRPLSQDEMREIRAVSSRGEITPTRYVNTYEWGDFKGDPAKWMRRYFDAFLYLANWGTRELMLRFPARALDPELARRYLPGGEAALEVAAGFAVVQLTSVEEGGDDWFEEGSGLLASILPVRAEIAGGDYRALYLAWLMWAHQGEDADEDAEEPPVPPGLRKLSGAQRAFADFLRIDPDLIHVAAERSADASLDVDAGEMRSWIAALADDEKTGLLVRVAEGSGTLVGAELLKRFRDARGAESGDALEPRTVAQLLAAAEQHAEERIRREREKANRAQARREREAAEARELHLAELAKIEEESWRRVDDLIAEKKAPAYDAAVHLIADLREVAVRQGRGVEADVRIGYLRQHHATKLAFLKRLKSVPTEYM